ncbi:uncharacterized protein LOC117120860 [Anneissia japonica]|uniref:uncharacterized protein LOC117120860 n=1 Tax=Anneissia japonica TaxID=1529436 RepID=UPI001425A0C1|nr:uncharacterized protein LOC117120860 [Anneissia japonica]
MHIGIMAIFKRICTCLCLLIFKYECAGVRLVLGPVNYAASPTENVRLRCQIREKGSAKIIWTYGSETILSYDRQTNRLLDPNLGSRYSITPSFGNNFDLNIQDVRVIDIGMYTCGYIGNKTVFSLKSIKLDVVQDTSVQVYPNCYPDQSLDRISPHDSVDLNCDAGLTISPNTKLSWIKRGTTLVSQVGEPYLSYHTVLTHDDYGVAFVCNVTDLLTDQYKTCRIVPLIFAQKTSLFVQIAPPIIEAQVGNEAIFTCIARGLESTEQPRYSWSITNTDLITSKRVFVQNKILKIINIQPDDDRSRFTCEVITDTRRRGSRDTVLYVALPRPRVTTPTRTTTNTGPRTHTLLYFNETTNTFVPNITNTNSNQRGLRSGIAVVSALVLIFIIIIAVEVARRRRNRQRSGNAVPTGEREAVFQDAATVGDSSRFSFMQIIIRFSRTFSSAPPKKPRRVRFANQESMRKPKKVISEHLYDFVPFEEENPKSNKKLFKKPKLFLFEEGSVYKNITKNMSNNCSLISYTCKYESHPVTCACVLDDVSGKMSLANPDTDTRPRTHPGNLEIISKGNPLKPPKLQLTSGLDLVYADLDFHEKTHESPTLMQVLLRLRGNEYAEIRTSVK